MANWVLKKIRNQFLKVSRKLQSLKEQNLKNTLKHCGEGTSINMPVIFAGAEYITMGNDVKIGAFVHIWGHGGVVIGNDCLIASHVSITSLTHDNSTGLYRDTVISKPVTIGNNVWIGSHAVILPGVTIGNNAIVGAGAVVAKNVPEGVVVVGVPAAPIAQKENQLAKTINRIDG